MNEEGSLMRGFQHVGYMNKIFKTKPEACALYDKFNPHMRSLNCHNTYCSDWDPDTRLRYVVRKFNHEIRIIPIF